MNRGAILQPETMIDRDIEAEMDAHEKRMSRREPLTREQEIGRASLYALVLKGQGKDPEEIKKAVSERYPRAKGFLDEVYPEPRQ